MNFAIHVDMLRDLLDKPPVGFGPREIAWWMDPELRLIEGSEQVEKALAGEGFKAHKWHEDKSRASFILPGKSGSSLELKAKRGKSYAILAVGHWHSFKLLVKGRFAGDKTEMPGVDYQDAGSVVRFKAPEDGTYQIVLANVSGDAEPIDLSVWRK